MHDLFYSETEKLAFWVAGYLDHDGEVSTVLNAIKEGEAKFKQLANLEDSVGPISTSYIAGSRRYKYMRVFYASVPYQPEGAFLITGENDWTMWKWLTD
jgi:hypothetical protein